MSTSAIGPVRLHGLTFDVAAVSEQGPRNENQDAYAVDAFPTTGLLLVADGMGGQKAGRFAADTALRTVLSAGPIRSLDAARFAIRSADEAVSRAAREDPAERDQMGCALAMLAAVTDRGGQPGWVGAHVGDVRILSRSPDGTMRLETRDHSLAFAHWEAGEVGLDEIPDTPGANRLVRAVGHGGEPDTVWIPLRPGWSYLLVSDGITKAMRLDELGHTLTLPDMAATVAAIARKVEERGPDDNYTAVAVRILDGPQAQFPGMDRDPDVTREHPPTAPMRPAAPPLRTEEPVTASRSGLPWLLFLSVLALGLAGFALWTATRSAGLATSVGTQVDSLSRRVDSLQTLVAPARIDSVTAAAGDTATPAAAAPAPATPTRTAPR